jgi:hypothetical protein
MPAVAVAGSASTAERFACPDSHPNLWNWDVAQSEHIQVRMVGVDAFSATIEGVNATNVAGVYVVSLGCSTEPYNGTGVLNSRHLAPSANLQGRRPATPVARPNVGDPEPEDPCAYYNTPNCKAQKQVSFWLGPWATVDRGFACTNAPYLYTHGYTYAQTGSPSVSAMWDGSHDNPMVIGIDLTNWNPVYSELVVVSVACTSTPPNGNCGAAQADPQCPLIAGSQKTHCAPGPIPVCFLTYQERCAATKQLYNCVNDLGPSWCSPCAG